MKLVTPLIIITISIGMYFMYISPTTGEVKTRLSQKSAQSDVLAKTRQLSAKREAVLVDYNNISSENIDRLNKIIPDAFNSVLFANDVAGVASRYGLIIKNFQINQPKTEIRDAVINVPRTGIYRTTLVAFRLQGQYSQFVNFLNDLETNLRLVDVVSLSIKPVGVQGSSSSSLEYFLEVETYSLQ